MHSATMIESSLFPGVDTIIWLRIFMLLVISMEAIGIKIKIIGYFNNKTVIERIQVFTSTEN